MITCINILVWYQANGTRLIATKNKSVISKVKSYISISY